LNENAFISFARDRGTTVHGVTSGDPGLLNERGWLPGDGFREDEALLFHPFRVYPLHRILEACKLPVAASSTLDRDAFSGFVSRVLDTMMPSIDKIGAAAAVWNRTADLAILLEPLFWPAIIGKATRSAFTTDEEYGQLLTAYREKLLGLVSQLDPEEWQKIHEGLRIDAARTDDNGALYLLLRLSSWGKRENLKGRVSLALWIRQMAEVLRRAFEDVHHVQWPEEDRAFGYWAPGGRILAYGSDCPLDAPSARVALRPRHW
jgi:hypothetical protein